MLNDSCAESCHEEAQPLGTHYTEIRRNREQWLEACREVRSLTKCAKQNSWRSFMESMKGKTSLSHVWLVIRSLNRKRSPPMARNTVLEHGGRNCFVSDTAKAYVFIKHYASVSRHKLSRAKRKTDLTCVLD
jgi:hypothetical protein